MNPHRLYLPLIAAMLFPTAVLAQTEDQSIQEERDRRYYETYLKRQKLAEATGEDLDRDLQCLKQAESYIRDRNLRSSSTAHYVVLTNTPGIRVEAVAELLEAMHAYFMDFWPAETALRPFDEASRVFLFNSRYHVDELWDASCRPIVSPGLQYRAGPPRFAMYGDITEPGAIETGLAERAAVQLVARCLGSQGEQPSRWVGRGLADYFAYTFRDKAGLFRFGLIGGKSVSLREDQTRDEGRQIGTRLRKIRRFLESQSRGDGSFVEDLIAGNTRLVGGKRKAPEYDLAWPLVHFLLHGEEGAHNGAMLRYLNLEFAGEGSPEAFYEAVGMDAATLESKMTAHLDGLKSKGKKWFWYKKEVKNDLFPLESP